MSTLAMIGFLRTRNLEAAERLAVVRLLDVGLMCGGCRVDVGRMWGGCGVDIRWVWLWGVPSRFCTALKIVCVPLKHLVTSSFILLPP